MKGKRMFWWVEEILWYYQGGIIPTNHKYLFSAEQVSHRPQIIMQYFSVKPYGWLFKHGKPITRLHGVMWTYGRANDGHGHIIIPEIFGLW